MKALTLHQPWAWAFCYAGKPVENRSWAPPPGLIGQRFALHAGLHVDADGVDYLVDCGIAMTPSSLLRRRDALVVRSRRLTDGRWEHGVYDEAPLVRGAIVATVRLVRARRIEDIPVAERTVYHFGPWCWECADTELVKPIPMKGWQKLWNVPEGTIPRPSTQHGLASPHSGSC